MKASLGLPTHHVGHDVATATGIEQVAQAAETAGFDAVFVTDHPFPSDRWLATGGHHALDPFVALSFAAAATTRLRLHTNLLVLAYRSPFHSAKAIASLDALSKGRVIVGVGAGYLEPEFEALGVEFEHRNELTDEAILAMRAAWTGESVTAEGHGWRATGNTMQPAPAQQPGPPIWIGGNSRRAIRRAVELADGWMPMPSPSGSERRLHTPAIASLGDLARRLDYARAHAATVGRTEPLEVVFMPSGLDMFTNGTVDPGPVLESVHALAGLGVTYLTVTLPGRSVQDLLEHITTFAAEVLAPIQDL
ncbi:MAG TPA: TIGR03619 family F420-dependent LLM class oxidoreductase [Acidimicrobiia bacterium]|nr:TIGR03619 family F420-dependent LLM class oxidoreductase [Acidimicrobiia bacterium]